MGKLIVRKGPIGVLNHNHREPVSAPALYLLWDGDHAQRSHQIRVVLYVVMLAMDLQLGADYAGYNNIISI